MPSPPSAQPYPQPASQPPAAGAWVAKWLSPPRHAMYLAAAGGDPVRALALYEWNARLSAAVFRDLAHLEVALRNAYDLALSAGWPGPPHWTSAGGRVFAPLYRTRNGRRIDINERVRSSLSQALVTAGGSAAPPGKVVAELMFGFWRYLSSAAHEKALWVPCLHRAFPAGTDRERHVDSRVRRLHQLRNRVAHHEPLLRTNLAARLDDLLGLASLIDHSFGQYLRATTAIPALVANRP